MAHPADKYANATQPWMRYQPRRDTLTAYKPTMAQRIPDMVKDGLRALGLNKFAANAFGTPVADVLGYSPVGAVAQSWDAGQAAARADGVGGKALGLGGGMALAALGAVPGGKALARKGEALAMDEASRMARAAEQGFDTSIRRVPNPRVSPDILGKLSAAESEYRDAVRGLQSLPRKDGMTYEKVKANLYDKWKRGEYRGNLDSDAFEILQNYPHDEAAKAAAMARVDAARAARDTLDEATKRDLQGMYHGTPDASWLSDPKAMLDAKRTHDMQLAYGRSPAYLTESPEAASGYTRAGASWGNGSAEQNAPGVMNVLVRAKNPFDLNKYYDAKTAKRILGPDLGGLNPEDERWTGKEIWNALVEQSPSYNDLRAESQLFGGEIDDLLPKSEANARLKALGFDALSHVDNYNPGGGGAHRVVIPFSGSQIRSRFAAFDPAKRGSSDLLAALGLGGLGYGLMSGSSTNWSDPTQY